MNKVDTPGIIVPWVFTKRIESRHAKFTYSSRKYINEGREDITDEIRLWESLDWFEVPAGNKNQIKQDLEKLQIQEKTLFPDLDGLARYLKDGGYS